MNNGVQFINGYKWVDTYYNGRKIAGSQIIEVSGEALSVANTYNDSAWLKINGNTQEIGEGEKSPDNPYELKSVGDDGGFDLVSVGNAGQLQTINFPYTLRSVPNGVTDYAEIGEGGKRLIKNISDTVVLNGNLDWRYTNTYEYTHRFIINTWGVDKNILFNTADSGIAISDDGNYPIVPRPAGTESDRRSICFHSNNYLYLRVEKEKIDVMEGETVLDKFKNYLNLYPVTLIYQFAEPEITPIECEDVKTYYPYTNIYTISTVQPTFEAKIRVWTA